MSHFSRNKNSNVIREGNKFSYCILSVSVHNLQTTMKMVTDVVGERVIYTMTSPLLKTSVARHTLSKSLPANPNENPRFYSAIPS
jgi:hypothetical protein